MELFSNDRDRLAFLLETDAALDLDFEALEARGRDDSGEEPAKRPSYVTNYIGSKQKLVDWIWKHTPDGVSSVLDAFSGSAVVAYMYKSKGLAVTANDRLRYCHHVARAIIENRSIRVSEEDLEALVADNPKAGSFVRDHFKGIFFARGVHGLIDTVRANIDRLSGFKKDIALFALGRTCVSGKGGFGHFSSTTPYGKREDTPAEFKERFAQNVRRINALVFDNGAPCRARRRDVNDFLPDAKADLVYFDPPYATEFSTTNYEKAYHFVEGLMTYWRGLKLVEGSKTRHYETDHKTITAATAKSFFEGFLGHAKHIPHWLISYRDHAYPNEREMRALIAAHGFAPAMRSHDHHYSITSRHGEASQATERLFICTSGKGQSAMADAEASDALRSEAIWEETANEIRYRVRDPEQFEPDSFRRKALEGIEGVWILIGRLKEKHVPEGGKPSALVLQAYRFARKTTDNPDGWTLEKAKEWIEKHEVQAEVEAALRVEENLSALAAAPLGEALDLLSCQAGKADTVRVTGFMGSKYLMLDWIERQVPIDAKSFLDAFSGGANVAYHFKRRGMKVIANDLLRFPYHLARAVIENSTETLSDEDVEMLLASNPQAGTFIVDHFHGYYYTKPVLEWLDRVWANIQRLPGYKKDLALAALGTTVKAKSAFGQFSRSKKARADLESEASLEQSQLSNPPLSKFIESFRRSVRQLNRLVFDNGQPCQALHLDGAEAVRRFGADVLYLDPPYVTEFGTNDYEDALHFVEGLMTRWADKTLRSNPRRNFPSRTRFSKESIRKLIQTLAADARDRYPTVLLSYRDRAFPREEEIRDIFGTHYGRVRVTGMEVEYNIAKDIGREGKHARELLFVSSRPRSAPRSAAGSATASCHTSIPVDLVPSPPGALSAAALDRARNGGDPQFSFVLCRSGTNKNGDHFTPEELAARYQTAIHKKIDLKHSQDFTDIVGSIVAADFVEETGGGRIECTGELYVTDSPHAQLAYKLIRKGIITQVSMECDYEEGECSICHKQVASKDDYCLHLRKHKGGTFQGQPVFEILHGVTFSGLGLLDRKGADEDARIIQVASERGEEISNQGGLTMDDKQKAKDEAAEAAKKNDPGGGGGGNAPEDKARVQELETENKELKQQVLALQKKLEELEAEQQAAANRAKAQKLLAKVEKHGVGFAGDEEREKELTRLAGLSEEAFTATEAAFDRMIQVEADKAKKGETKPEEKSGNKAKADETSQDKALRSDAGVRPQDVDDQKTSLEDRLTHGLMAAYRQRVGIAPEQPGTQA